MNIKVTRSAAIAAGSLMGAASLVVGLAGPSIAATRSHVARSALLAELTKLEKGAPKSSVTLSEGGSTLIEPVFQSWGIGYHKQYKNITVSTAGGGSSTGIANGLSGAFNIGASDVYLSPGNFQANPGAENIPLAIASQTLDYNVPGVSHATHIKLNGAVLSAMYDGSITTWNNSAIKKLNPGLKLPGTKVVPLYRTKGSGDTFNFTSYLAASDPSSWINKGTNTGPSLLPVWPAYLGSHGAGETSNALMESVCAATKGCISYVGTSEYNTGVRDGLGSAALQNLKHKYVAFSLAAAASEAESFQNIPANGVQSMVYGSPRQTAYPIVNLEYAIVNKKFLSGATKAAVKSVLAWIVDPRHGSNTGYLSAANFLVLPTHGLAVTVNLLKAS
jgi:phosphate transport system substrate-binding protein